MAFLLEWLKGGQEYWQPPGAILVLGGYQYFWPPREWVSSFLPRQQHHRDSVAAANMVNDTTISTIALAVALVALITTVSQVLGQFLATADGYRRCQASVMGGWAKMTHRHFRWSEMRFETLYTTPRFNLSGMESRGNERRYPLNGTPSMMSKTHCQSYRYSSASATSLVSWLKFMEALHLNTHATFHRGVSYALSWLSLPEITIEKRSWDFVPPEVVRPLAVVSISDIAILARRLGMIWRQFEPLDGNLRAEGNGHTISSAAVRSMGTVLTIGIQDPLPKADGVDGLDEVYIPMKAADKMGFGIVPGEPGLGIPDYKVGTEEEVLTTLRNVVDPSHEAADQVKGILGANPGWTPGISDVIGFACPMIHIRGSSLVRVPQPAGYAIGLTQQQEGFIVFRNRLKDLIAEREAKAEPVSPQLRSIYEQYEELRQRYGDQWEDEHSDKNKMPTALSVFLDDLNTRHEATTIYFSRLMRRFNSVGEKAQEFKYTDLMYSHIRHAVNYFPEALERLNASPSRARNHYGMRVAGWITEGAHIYFDNIPKIINDMRDKGFDQPQIVEEAWVTMMFRAFLWHRCHFMVEGPRVPSIYWGSNLPVYIG